MRPRADRPTSAVSTSDGRTSSFTISMVRPDVGRIEPVALLEQRDELLEEMPDAFGLGPVDGDLVAADVDVRAVERLLDGTEQLVTLAE